MIQTGGTHVVDDDASLEASQNRHLLSAAGRASRPSRVHRQARREDQSWPKDPVRAKSLHARALLELDERWTNLRAGPKLLSEREAHEMVAPPYAWWIDQYRDEPSQQAFWRTDLGDNLWPRRPPGLSLQPNLGAALI